MGPKGVTFSTLRRKLNSVGIALHSPAYLPPYFFIYGLETAVSAVPVP